MFGVYIRPGTNSSFMFGGYDVNYFVNKNSQTVYWYPRIMAYNKWAIRV
jgi:hypothetical protein